jgi:amino acid transporter
VAAITSAVPSLFEHRIAIGLVAIVLMVMVNLRGIRESGMVFAVPTHLAIAVLIGMVGTGIAQILFGYAQPVAPQAGPGGTPVVESLSAFLVLRAFAGGCTAVTGMEVISNGVKAFRKPESHNASVTMLVMSLILATLFMGISALAYYYGIIPKADETVVSQLARTIFGGGPLYYVTQVSTMILLILAANSAFTGFPHLASILARDSYMPHQMATFGDRLVFSNGITILGVLAVLLLVIFQGDTHALIPLYAVGVFVSFTLSQAGMVKRWMSKKGPHWRKKLAINGIGAVTTGVATLIIGGTKFMHGAWIVVALTPPIILWFRSIRAHYIAVDEQITLERDSRPPMPRKNTVIIPISGVNRAVIRAVDYARSRGTDIRAVLVDVDKENTAKVEMQWAQWGCGVQLVVLPSPYRSVMVTLMDYIEETLEKDSHGWVTVVIPEILPARWWQNILHNQRALMLKGALLFKERVILTDVPFHLER